MRILCLISLYLDHESAKFEKMELILNMVLVHVIHDLVEDFVH